MDDVDIICATNVAVCKEILENFLTSFQKDHLQRKIQDKTDKEMALTNSSIFIFFNSPEIDKDINTTLYTVNPNENFIMVIVVTHGQKEEKIHSRFTLPSKVIMWCSIWGAEDKKCPDTEENMRANIMLDCFLKIITSRRDKAMNIQDKEETLITSDTRSRVYQEVQPMDTETDLTNEISDRADDAVIVACSKISESFFKSFSNFMATKIGVSTRMSRNSKSAPQVALCVQHDDTKREIEELYSVTGGPATVIMITACEVGVPLPPIQSSIGKDIFPNGVRLRYSDTSETIYDCPENKRAEEILKKLFGKSRKPFAISCMGSWLQGKNQAKKSQDSSKVTKKEIKLERTSRNRGEQDNTAEHSFPNCDFVILCNRKVEVCKDILMKFKSRYSVSNEFQWMPKAQDVRNVIKRVVVCLKISRLADDIKDAINMVGLSDDDTFFLFIIHTAEPGIEVDTSFHSWDPRIVDVAHILYSESYECYDCPENKSAISKFRSWSKFM